MPKSAWDAQVSQINGILILHLYKNISFINKVQGIYVWIEALEDIQNCETENSTGEVRTMDEKLELEFWRAQVAVLQV